MPFFGTGGLGERVWSGPAITVTGIDALSVAQAVNAVVPEARAKLNLRVHPEQDPEEAQAALSAISKGCARSGSRSRSSRGRSAGALRQRRPAPPTMPPGPRSGPPGAALP